MNLRTSFVRRIQNTFRQRRRLFLKALPGLMDEAAQRWQLTDIHPAPNLSYNYVAFARRLDAEVVLKIGPPNDELSSELAALRLFNGQGCCRLLEADEAEYTFLLERLRPGRMLSELLDDEQATHIAAQVMQRLWREVLPAGVPGSSSGATSAR